MPIAPNDYAALMRMVRDTESFQLEIHKLKTQIKQLESQLLEANNTITALKKEILEKDSLIEDMRKRYEKAVKEMTEKLRQQEAQNANLRRTLLEKEKELEEEKSKGLLGRIIKK